jgi:hypothetical protein
MKVPKGRPRGGGSNEGEAQGASRDSSQGSSKPPLEQIKPPREWRSPRRDAPASGPTAAPRVVRHVPAEMPAAPAGSHAPDFGAPAGSHTAVAEPQFVEAPPDLPVRYGIDRLVILVRDPHWVYAWWELTESRLQQGQSDIGTESDVVLRIYDISCIDWNGSNHHSFFDIEVEDLAGNWYIELGRPGASFCAELGLRAPDGRFLALVRSNIVTLPRDSMSHIVDEEWMIVEEDYRLLFDQSGGSSIGLGSGEILRMLEQRLKSELASGGVSSFSKPASEKKPAS